MASRPPLSPPLIAELLSLPELGKLLRLNPLQKRKEEGLIVIIIVVFVTIVVIAAPVWR